MIELDIFIFISESGCVCN